MVQIQAIENYAWGSNNTSLLDLKVGRNDYVFKQRNTVVLRQLEVVQNAAVSKRSCIAMNVMIDDELEWVDMDARNGIRYQLETLMVYS